jgi:hypothetical protein
MLKCTNGMKNSAKFILIFALSVGFLMGVSHPLFAYVMSSGDYRIQSDDALTPTGGMGTSAHYIFKDTMGQVSSGVSDSALYKMKAGFQQMQEVSLSVSAPSNTPLVPNIPGITGGTANADTHWTVQTDGSAGFDMKISASTVPAMRLDGSYYFDDYPTSPTYNWGIGANAAKFGFAVLPATTGDATAFEDNGATCGAGGNVGHCWSGLSTTPTTIIHRTSRTSPTGENELITFQAQSNKFLKSGEYSSLVTITVSSN